jgi:hypothetical protein
MSKDAEYRLRAIECAEAAERTGDLHERLELLKMAQAWAKLAEYARAVPTFLARKRNFPLPEGTRSVNDEQ